METWQEISAWRKSRREELLAVRTAVSPAQRKAWGERITEFMDAGFPAPCGGVVGLCWPHKGEADARFLVRRWRERGATAALPEVVAKGSPLRFRKWWPGAPMKAGVYDIPVPDGTEVLLPDVAIVPMNGFDEFGYRLGYGGGYFDRTLAALERRVLAIGVSYEALRLPTIHPQSHDIPMDFVVTEAGIYRAGGRKLVSIDAADCAGEAKALMASRGLPRRHPAPAAAAAQGGYSSPACSAHEIAPDYFGEQPPMPAEELVAFLNTLLAAERAGAKALAAFLDDYERDTPAWKQLAAVQRDEAGNCAVLIDLVRRMKGTPSATTGDFLGKALAVEGRVARLRFLNRGQQWVARKIDEALPHIEQESVRGALAAMQESHLLNIEACDALVETLVEREA
ncbi:MAG: 5-formyltetrahydrofolate cyclo-ligase [Burkholderiales bacterium]|nr:5-formyltetrahydrofolate cyclo-ligase [Burkholderiales bacterium]